MARYQFVSEGALASNALEQFLMERDRARLDEQRDRYLRGRDEEDRRHRAEALKVEQSRESRIAERQTKLETEADVARQRERKHVTDQGLVRGMMADRLTMGPLTPADAHTIGIMATRENMAIPAIIAQAMQPERRTVMRTTDQRGNPIRRAVTDEELTAGVPEYVAPTRAPRATRAEAELPTGVQDYLVSLKTKIDPETGQRYTLERAEDEIVRQWPRLRDAHPRLSPERAKRALETLFRRPSADDAIDALLSGVDVAGDAAFGDDGDWDDEAEPDMEPAPMGTGKTATMGEVQAVAEAAGISADDARRRLEAAGVVIQR